MARKTAPRKTTSKSIRATPAKGQLVIAGKRRQLKPKDYLAEGGEAEIYRLDARHVAKLFKQPDHPALALSPELRQAAELRLLEHQDKLREFPSGLPAEVIVPVDLISAGGGQIVGYTMPYLADAETLYHWSDPGLLAARPVEEVLGLFEQLQQLLLQLHQRQVVVGDFNDLNVLVRDGRGHLIDADSMQFGRYACRVFTERFVDPLLCDPAAPRPVLTHLHSAASDHYALAVMFMRALLGVGPHGGVHKPVTGSRVATGRRPLERLTVFHPEVRLPKVARPPSHLPEPLAEHFRQVFEQDMRTPLPESVLDAQLWSHCDACGLNHGRGRCPGCQQRVAQPARTVHGQVHAETILETTGLLLAARWDGRTWQTLVHDGESFLRDGHPLLRAELPRGGGLRRLRTVLHGDHTVLASGQQALVLASDGSLQRQVVDNPGGLPAVASDGERLLSIENGVLKGKPVKGPLDPEILGTSLAQQTQLFADDNGAVGCYRAGQLQGGWLLRRGQSLPLDNLQLPAMAPWLDVWATTSSSHVWLTILTQSPGRLQYHVLCLDWQGQLLGSVAGPEWGDGAAGAVAAGSCLHVPTDDGIVRVEVQGQKLAVTRRFVDTEPWVSSNSQLLLGPGGLAVRDARCLVLLTLP